MIPRLLATQLKSLATQYPVVTIVGPRQSGKSTLCQFCFPNLPLINLELPDVRARVLADPKGFIENLRGGCVIDEIQHVPDLASYIQVAVDERGKKGEFILTGSQQYQLMESVSQSLAGRTALLRLLPLSAEELNTTSKDKISFEQKLFTGGYPRIYNDSLDPSQALSFYTQTYIERDVRQIINVRDLSLFERFLRLCASRSGQLLNASNLGNEAGINQSTVQQWLSVLETSFILTKIQPYYQNFSKRLIKSPKVYFLDTGLLCYLLGITSPEQLTYHPLRGAIVETYVASELLKAYYNRAREPRIYFFRDSTGNEVDFLCDEGDAVIPIEVKASSTFTTDFLRGISFFRKLPGARTKGGAVIYTGKERFSTDGIEIFPITEVAAIITGKENKEK